MQSVKEVEEMTNVFLHPLQGKILVNYDTSFSRISKGHKYANAHVTRHSAPRSSLPPGQQGILQFHISTVTLALLGRPTECAESILNKHRNSLAMRVDCKVRLREYTRVATNISVNMDAVKYKQE